MCASGGRLCDAGNKRTCGAGGAMPQRGAVVERLVVAVHPQHQRIALRAARARETQRRARFVDLHRAARGNAAAPAPPCAARPPSRAAGRAGRPPKAARLPRAQMPSPALGQAVASNPRASRWPAPGAWRARAAAPLRRRERKDGALICAFVRGTTTCSERAGNDGVLHFVCASRASSSAAPSPPAAGGGPARRCAAA